MDTHIFTIFWITLVAGSFGGIVNYYMLDDEIKKEGELSNINKHTWYYKLFKSIVIGIGASFTVPLFLQTISSNLIDQCKGDQKFFFIYAGFCLIAAIFSRRFLDTVAERALKTAQKAEEKSTIAIDKANDLKPIRDKFTETDEEEIDESDLESLVPDIQEKVRVDIDKIKNVLQKSKYAYRTLKGIAKEAGSEENIVKIILEEMEQIGITRRIVNEGNNKTLWTLVK